MSEPCPDCGAPTVAFRVPADLADYAPDGDDHAAVCTTCLRVQPAADGDTDPSFDAVFSQFPAGDGGVALALALGRLDSLALERAAVVTLCERAERAGVDVLLTLDRLASAGRVEPHFDIDRRRSQLGDFLED